MPKSERYTPTLLTIMSDSTGNQARQIITCKKLEVDILADAIGICVTLQNPKTGEIIKELSHDWE